MGDTKVRGARWMTLRYAGNCAQCKTRLPVEAHAFYDPSDKTVCCTNMVCAEKHGVTEEKFIGAPGTGHYVTVLSQTRVKPSGEYKPMETGTPVAASTMSALLPGVSLDAGAGMVALQCPNCAHVEDAHDCGGASNG